MNSMRSMVLSFIVVVGSLIFLGGAMFIESKLILKSSSFYNGSSINAQYTCDGENVSPELSWTIDTPQKVASYILIVDDPDAQQVVGKTFVHWIALLPATITSLPEGISGNSGSTLQTLDSSAVELANSYGKPVYMGPCPPPHGDQHTYRFTLFATTQSVATIAQRMPHTPCTAEEFKEAFTKNIIVQTVITARYGR